MGVEATHGFTHVPSLLFEKSNRLLHLCIPEGVAYSHDLWWACPSRFGEECYVVFCNAVCWINEKCTVESCLSLVIALLHHQANSQVSPWLRQTITQSNRGLKGLLCLIPLACLHRFQALLKKVFLLDELIESEVWPSQLY